MPKDVAADQRIIALIERYEQLCQEVTEDMKLSFIEDDDTVRKEKRGKALDHIIEEFNETYGMSDDENIGDLQVNGPVMGKRANSAINLGRQNSMIPASISNPNTIKAI